MVAQYTKWCNRQCEPHALDHHFSVWYTTNNSFIWQVMCAHSIAANSSYQNSNGKITVSSAPTWVVLVVHSVAPTSCSLKHLLWHHWLGVGPQCESIAATFCHVWSCFTFERLNSHVTLKSWYPLQLIYTTEKKNSYILHPHESQLTRENLALANYLSIAHLANQQFVTFFSEKCTVYILNTIYRNIYIIIFHPHNNMQLITADHRRESLQQN